MRKKPKNIPDKPGVYIFRDSKNRVLYVGRAVSLKRRIANYFQKNLDPRIGEMVSLAKNIKITETENLLEAIILEANLIKKYWPKYNVKEKDNRSFVYIVFAKTNYPYPIIIRGTDLKKILKPAYIFGPYQSLSLVKNALKIIRRIFPYSTCKPNTKKACFYRQINLCPGVCTGEISKSDYNKIIKNIILLLSGQKKRLLAKLKKENPASLKALVHIQDVSLITKEEDFKQKQMERIECYDISHLTGKEVYGAMAVFENGKAAKKEYRLFKTREANNDLMALKEVLLRRFNHDEWKMPDLIVIDGGRPQVNFLSPILQERNIIIPLVGISKYGQDRLVFPAKTKKSARTLIATIKPILLKARNEAHRFGLRASRRKRNMKI